MGGKAAKERRRLQRQAVAGVDSARSTKESIDRRPRQTVDTRIEVSADGRRYNQSKKSRPSSLQNDRYTSQASDRQHHLQSKGRNLPAPKNRPPTKDTAIKQKKFKKPKHLKRKLEKLGETNVQDREKLMKALSEFERRKSQLSSNRPPGAKRLHVATAHEELASTPDETTIPFAEQSKLNGGQADDSELEKEPSPKKPALKQKHVPSASADDDSDDSESGVSLDDQTRRQRGRRRRGRQETSSLTQEMQLTQVEKKPSDDTGTPCDVTPADTATTKSTSPNNTERSKSGDTRRCIGRKPVTDFTVGQRYAGKVIYIKPFGAFIDIGCHSDAFCHVSRVKDDYVESIHDVIKEGDKVNPRVVEIDRKAKQITVSLQSDARIEDERASAEARKHRKEKRNLKTPNTKEQTSYVEKHDMEWKRDRYQESSSSSHAPVSTKADVDAPLDEANMTPAQLKRARKLARRAARRAQKEESGTAA